MGYVYTVGLPEPVSLTLRDLLGDRHELRECARTGDALEQVEAQRPDAIVTEILFDDSDGLTLIRALRELETRIPVVAVSMIAQPVSRSHLYLKVATHLGADFTFAEPLNVEDLAECVDKLCVAPPPGRGGR